MQAAYVRARKMAGTLVYSGTQPDGRAYYLVTSCPYMIENINRVVPLYLDQQDKLWLTPQWEPWENSAGCRKNVLNGRLTEIGVGIAGGVNDSGKFCGYCVQLFLHKGYKIFMVDKMQIK